MRRVIISVAPIGPWGSGRNNPLEPGQLADEMAACAANGAAVLHLHARTPKGDLTADLSTFSAALDAVKQRCDVIVEASTGGLSELTAQERALTVTNRHAELGSLNLGSLNFGDQVYVNSIPDVVTWIETMNVHKVKPSLEIFDTGHIRFVKHLIQRGVVTPPYNFSFIFDVDWGMGYSPELLSVLQGMLPPHSSFGCIFIGNATFDGHIAGAKAGAEVLRVGFEDSTIANGKEVTSNADLVSSLRTRLVDEGFSIATVDQARSMLTKKFV